MKTAMTLEAHELASSHHEWTVAVVRKLIRKSRLKISELEELKSAGLFGLIEAAQRYRHDENCQFRSFAYKRIHGALIDHVRRTTKDSRRIFQDHKKPQQENGKKIKERKIIAHDQIAETAISSWTIEADRHDPELVLSNNETNCLLEKLVSKLPSRKLELIKRHYYQEEEFKSIGKSWNKTSKSWMSKLHHQILDDLKEELIKAGYQR